MWGCLVSLDSIMSSSFYLPVCRRDTRAVNINKPLPAGYRQVFDRPGSPASRHQGGVESARDTGMENERLAVSAEVGRALLLPVECSAWRWGSRNLNRKGLRLGSNESHWTQAELSIQKLTLQELFLRTWPVPVYICQSLLLDQSFPPKRNLIPEAVTDLEGYAAGSCCLNCTLGASLLRGKSEQRASSCLSFWFSTLRL